MATDHRPNHKLKTKTINILTRTGDKSKRGPRSLRARNTVVQEIGCQGEIGWRWLYDANTVGVTVPLTLSGLIIVVKSGGSTHEVRSKSEDAFVFVLRVHNVQKLRRVTCIFFDLLV